MQILKAGRYDKGFTPLDNKHLMGFTLLELIVVIFILSLVAGIVMPSFYRFAEGELRSEARKMASLLRYLNDNAISKKESFFIRFNLDDKTVSWSIPDGERSDSIDTLFSVSTPSAGELLSGEIALFFGPLGLQEHLTVVLRDNNRTESVSFNPLSGRAKVVSGE